MGTVEGSQQVCEGQGTQGGGLGSELRDGEVGLGCNHLPSSPQRAHSCLLGEEGVDMGQGSPYPLPSPVPWTRTTAGVHPNPHRLPKSAIIQVVRE